MRYDVTTGPIDARELEAAVAHPGAGAICTFTGIVRDNSRGQSVTHLDYEAFAEMAVPQMRHIGQEIKDRWPGARVAMAHRTGKLERSVGRRVGVVPAPLRGHRRVQVGNRPAQGIGADLEERARRRRDVLDRGRRSQARLNKIQVSELAITR